MTDSLKQLEERIGDLVTRVQSLRQENDSVKSSNQQLADEHAKLMEKTKIARARIESMIGRLKALERS
jgi:cell division protein ZapB